MVKVADDERVGAACAEKMEKCDGVATAGNPYEKLGRWCGEVGSIGDHGGVRMSDLCWFCKW